VARRDGIVFVGYEAENIEHAQADLQDAQIVAISGHHYSGASMVWGEGGQFLLGEDLPSSDTVEAVTFSACNTIKHPPDDIIVTIQQKYPNLQVIFGYNTKAPLYDSKVWEKAIPLIQRAVETENFAALERYVEREGIVGRGKSGPQKLGLYVKGGDEWNFCSPDGCKKAPLLMAAVAGTEVRG